LRLRPKKLSTVFEKNQERNSEKKSKKQSIYIKTQDQPPVDSCRTEGNGKGGRSASAFVVKILDLADQYGEMRVD